MKVTVLKGEGSKEIDIDMSTNSKISDNTIGVLNRVIGQSLKQGTKATKTRSQVRGKSAKPYNQKGTGNARQGSRKGPHFRGGGIAHGSKPDYTSLGLNRKFKNLISKKLLSKYLNEGNLGFVDLKDEVKGLRKSLSDTKSLIIYSAENSLSLRTIRNLPKLKLLNFSSISPLNLLNYNKIYFDLDTKEKVLELLK